MATIDGLNKARMLAIEAASVVSGLVNGSGHLILTKHDASTIDAGSVVGPMPDLQGLSTTSVAIALGSKTFTISPAMIGAFPVGATVKAQGAAAGNYMVGLVTASSSTSVTINVTEIAGTGTFSSWTLVIGSFRGTDGNVTGPAGGDLTGNFPNPTIGLLKVITGYLADLAVTTAKIADGAVTDVKVAAANKDGIATLASMRTLGTGALQAMAGNDTRVADSGWVDISGSVVAGAAPFADTTVSYLRYRKIGRLVHIQISKNSSAVRDMSAQTDGNFPNVLVCGIGTIPATARPDVNVGNGICKMNDVPQAGHVNTDGSIAWVGGYPRSYASGSAFEAAFVYMTTN